MSETEIRRANAADADQIFELAREFATSFTPERASFDVAFAHLVDQEDTRILVAEEGGRLIAYLLGFDHYAFFANGHVAWVEEIMVAEPQRRQGIGRALMDVFESWATERGSRLAALATRRASTFYESLGYEETAGYFSKMLN